VSRSAKILITLALGTPFYANAGTPIVKDIRPVETDSSDVFEILTTLRQADIALMARDFVSARAGYESVLLHDSSLTSARTGLRRTLIATGEIETAARWIDDPNSSDAVIIRVISGQENDPTTRIKSTLQSESDPRLWTLLGQLQDQAGHHLRARQSYAMANLAGARAGLAENNIGQSHWLAGEQHAALKAFEKAALADPDDIQFDNNRRRALIAIGRTSEALAGLDASRAGLFLAKAGDRAAEDGDRRLAQFLYRKSLEIAPRHNPHVERKLALLK